VACLRARATLVPINFRLTEDEAAWIARDAGVDSVLDPGPVMIMY
jgi:acyl-CoA synthetase (AMP-forming)/AMP-acid ligase II